MLKRNRRGRASYREFDLQQLLTCAIKDSSGAIGYSRSAELLAQLQLDTPNFRSALDGQLLNAESELALGGVVPYIALRQLQAFLKKLPDWHAKSADERSDVALSKFFQSEDRCKRATKRLRHYSKHWSRSGKNISETVINTAALVAQEILGPLGHDERMKILEGAKFGSGATFLHKRAESSAYYKLSSKHSITKEAIPLLREWMALSPRIHGVVKDQKLNVVDGNRLTTVPKDWDKDRLIAIEPSWNVFLQLGVNGYLKNRLKRNSLFIDDQTRGWSKAREGSINGSFATVDLSSASDTVSLGIVERIVPREWFEFLDSLRSKNYFHNGSWHRYHKFSSMGNGFTFPLETVLFYSLAKATAMVCGTGWKDIVVYGDDIIVPQEIYATFLQVLKWSGFEVNTNKSYCFGPFRETCGRDYLQGINVRPVYLREMPRDVEKIYSLHNRLLSFSLIPMPATLAYLRGCISNPHMGPGYLSQSEVNLEPFEVNFYFGKQHMRIRKKYLYESEWADRGKELESYLFSDPPERSRYQSDLQCVVYPCHYLSKRYGKDKRATDEYLCYLLFLLGIEGGKVLSTSKLKWFDAYRDISRWPDLFEVRRHGLESLQSY